MKTEFWKIFEYNINNVLVAKKDIGIGGLTIDKGYKIGRGITFNGIDLFQYIGHYLEVERYKGVYRIKGIY